MQFSVPTGSSCAQASPAYGGTCDANRNNINVNFGLKAGLPWLQTRGGDVRIDSGINNPIPPAPHASCVDSSEIYTSRVGSGTTPGVNFSGDRNYFFGEGEPSFTGWIVGGGTYPDLFNPENPTSLKTSYNYAVSLAKQNNTPPTSLNVLSGCSDFNNCQLNPSLTTREIYTSDTDDNPATLENVRITNFNFPGGGNKRVVFLINGNLEIDVPITGIPVGSSIVFIVKGDIIVDETVGDTVGAGLSCTGSPNLEGFFSTDSSFIAQGTRCAGGVPDRMLTIQGVVVTNAALGGGSFSYTQRDLCRVNNLTYPTVIIRDRPDLLLSYPDVLRSSNYLWQEVAP